jgi:hypothetical protein
MLLSSSGLLEMLLIYQLFIDYIGSKGLAQGMAVAIHTPVSLSEDTPREYAISVAYANNVRTAGIVRMPFL